MKRTSDQNEGRDYSSVIKKRKRISVAAGVVYEDEVLSPEISKCSTMTQTLLASNHSEDANKVRSSLSSLHGISRSGALSSLLSYVDTFIASRLPPGSALVSDQSSFATNVTETPCVCMLCGMAFKKQHSSQFCDVCHHKLTHPEEGSFLCKICKKSFKTRDDLVSHSKVHKEEELRQSIICNICKRVFSDTTTVKQYIAHSGK